MKSVHGNFIKEVQQGKNNNLIASFNSQHKAIVAFPIIGQVLS